MTVVGVAMVKDEADIIEATVRHMAANVDALLVADNGSTDGTTEILTALTAELRLVVYVDDDPAYLQAEKMTRLAQDAAFEFGTPEWVVPFDADEIWYSSFGPLREILAEVPDNVAVAQAGLFDQVAAGIDDQTLVDPTDRIRWRRVQPLPLPKVACRWRPSLRIHQGNHGCDYDGIVPAAMDKLVIRHFPYRSPEQLVRKVRNGAAAYRAAGDRLPAEMGKHWREWGHLLDVYGERAIHDLFHEWYWVADPQRSARLREMYIYDPAPVAGRKEAP